MIDTIAGRAMVGSLNHDELDRVIEWFTREAAPIIAELDKGKSDSEISMINQAGSTARLSLSRSTFRLLDMARQYSIMTGYAYDYTAASLYALWSAGEPTSAAIDQALNNTGMRYVETSDAGSIAFTAAGVSIDVGDLAYAYALDAGVVALRERIKGPFAVSVNGMLRRGHPFAEGEEPAFALTYRDEQTNQRIGSFTLRAHNAVVTRSRLARSLRDKPGMKSQLIDPRTGRPAAGTEFVAVSGPLATASFIIAEALLVLGKERGERILANFPGYDVMMVIEREPRIVWSTDGARRLMSLESGWQTAIWKINRSASETP